MRYIFALIVLCILAAMGSAVVLADVSDAYQGAIYYVSKLRGDDTNNNGSSWATAKKTIGGALTAAGTGSAQIWVSAETPNDTDPTKATGTTDTYDAPISSVADGVSIFGGFDGTETQRWQRNWREHVTSINGQITVGSGALDGFTIENPIGTGIVSTAYGLISHNIIKSVVIGIDCGPCAGPVIENNLITDFSTTGICGDYGLPCIVANNTIVHSGAKTGTAGIKLAASYPAECGAESTNISANIVMGCETGVYDPSHFSGNAPNNDIYDNTTAGISGWQQQNVDPLFVGSGSYELSSASTCIDVDGGNGYMQQLDLDCNPRCVDIPNVDNAEGNDGAVYDIGAYEYQAPPLINRGLPQVNINSSAGANRANIRWANSESGLFYGDDFQLPTGSWLIDKIRVWAIPSVPGYPDYCLGDHFSSIVLYIKDPSYPLIKRISADLMQGSNNCSDMNVHIKRVFYANGEGYQRADGGFDKIWQIDFDKLSWGIDGGSGNNFLFGVYGVPRVDRLWFNAASNAVLSGWSAGSNTNKIFGFNVDPLGVESSPLDFINPLAAWLGRNSSGTVRGSDINVQVFAHQR